MFCDLNLNILFEIYTVTDIRDLIRMREESWIEDVLRLRYKDFIEIKNVNRYDFLPHLYFHRKYFLFRSRHYIIQKDLEIGYHDDAVIFAIKFDLVNLIDWLHKLYKIKKKRIGKEMNNIVLYNSIEILKWVFKNFKLEEKYFLSTFNDFYSSSLFSAMKHLRLDLLKLMIEKMNFTKHNVEEEWYCNNPIIKRGEIGKEIRDYLTEKFPDFDQYNAVMY